MQISADTLLNLFDPALELAPREIALARVHAFELAAIDGRNCMNEQPELAANQNEPGAGGASAGAVVASEISDRLEIWRQAARQPHQLDIPLRLALKTPARLDAVQIPIEVNLEQRRRVIAWSPGVRGLCPVEISKILLVDVRIDHPRRIVVSDVIIETSRKKCLLRAIFALSKPGHAARVSTQSRDSTDGAARVSLNYTQMSRRHETL